ncbi:uncharacterized protein TNCV_4013521 [Trichonephila clavipes]|nr:uncharacterized protein TNCV_4013521 [Trichonephila clavipes]
MTFYRQLRFTSCGVRTPSGRDNPTWKFARINVTRYYFFKPVQTMLMLTKSATDFALFVIVINNTDMKDYVSERELPWNTYIVETLDTVPNDEEWKISTEKFFLKTKSLIQELWKTPPTHPWYNRQATGGALSIKADRVVQTTIIRLSSGHIRGLSFNLGQKIYENCTKCNLVQATPDHLLFCAGLEREDIYSSPLLVTIS